MWSSHIGILITLQAVAVQSEDVHQLFGSVMIILHLGPSISYSSAHLPDLQLDVSAMRKENSIAPRYDPHVDPSIGIHWHGNWHWHLEQTFKQLQSSYDEAQYFTTRASLPGSMVTHLYVVWGLQGLQGLFLFCLICYGCFNCFSHRHRYST